jgi:hypothetical protein
MRMFFQQSDGGEDFPCHITPLYVEEIEPNKHKEKEVEQEEEGEGEEGEEGKRKKIKKQKEKKITKDTIHPLAWCAMHSSDTVRVPPFGAQNPGVNEGREESVSRQSVPLYVLIAPCTDMLECLAAAYEIVTKRSKVSTSECHTKNTDYSTIRTKDEEEIFQIEVVRSALQVFKSLWPSQLSGKLLQDAAAARRASYSGCVSVPVLPTVVVIIENIKGKNVFLLLPSFLPFFLSFFLPSFLPSFLTSFLFNPFLFSCFFIFLHFYIASRLPFPVSVAFSLTIHFLFLSVSL